MVLLHLDTLSWQSARYRSGSSLRPRLLISRFFYGFILDLCSPVNSCLGLLRISYGSLTGKRKRSRCYFPSRRNLANCVISIGLFSLFNGIGPLSSNAILAISSIVLFAIVIAQIFYSFKLSARESRSEGIRLDLKLWSSTSAGIWMATTLGMLQS